MSSRRPRIGLALGSGWARGVAHIGTIEILERLRAADGCRLAPVQAIQER